MRNAEGEWLSPPPVWEIIQNSPNVEKGIGETDNNLHKYIEMGYVEEEGFGRVMEEREFLEWCEYYNNNGDGRLSIEEGT